MPNECPHHENIADKCGQIETLFKIVNEKVGLKSLIPIMAIVVMVLGIFIGILHSGYQDTIKSLQTSSGVLAKLFTEQGREVNQSLKSIEVKIAVMGADIEHIKKNGKK